MNDRSPRTPATERTIGSEADGALDVPKPFSERASRISCYASLALYVLGGLTTTSPLLWAVVVLIALGAFALGIVGIIGGVKRRATATIRLGTLGVLLSGLPLGLSAWLALRSG